MHGGHHHHVPRGGFSLLPQHHRGTCKFWSPDHPIHSTPTSSAQTPTWGMFFLSSSLVLMLSFNDGGRGIQGSLQIWIFYPALTLRWCPSTTGLGHAQLISTLEKPCLGKQCLLVPLSDSSLILGVEHTSFLKIWVIVMPVVLAKSPLMSPRGGE
jgi:hypothetical protein